ncbi:MAG: hypothetical protein ABI347_06905 [Nitrososphaera sp.]|jgi:hypothetical protein
MEHLIFHHNGREYMVYDMLTVDEIKAVVMMGKERDKKLNPLSQKSADKYFQDTDKMAAVILRRCFHMTDSQIAGIDQMERRDLASAFIRFLQSANKL